jgi:hypothetical protein
MDGEVVHVRGGDTVSDSELVRDIVALWRVLVCLVGVTTRVPVSVTGDGVCVVVPVGRVSVIGPENDFVNESCDVREPPVLVIATVSDPRVHVSDRVWLRVAEIVTLSVHEGVGLAPVRVYVTDLVGGDREAVPAIVVESELLSDSEFEAVLASVSDGDFDAVGVNVADNLVSDGVTDPCCVSDVVAVPVLVLFVGERTRLKENDVERDSMLFDNVPEVVT